MDSALAAKENTSIILMKKNANNIAMNKISAPLVFPSITSAELNYVAFGILSNDYHIELYGYLQQKVAVYLGKSTCSVKECDTYITQQNQFIETPFQVFPNLLFVTSFMFLSHSAKSMYSAHFFYILTETLRMFF